MNDQQILSVIKHYIQNRTINQALMITGEWGCGKSYFIKNIVKDYLRQSGILDNKDYIVFSLYGINDLVDFKVLFYDTIFIKQYLGESNKARKAKNIFERFCNSCFSTIDTSIIGVPLKINLAELIHKSDLVQLENCIFVFDDIERCKLSVTELWGFINKLTESKGIPVITVANESKILEKDSKNNNYRIEKEKAVYCTLSFSYDISPIFDKLVGCYDQEIDKEIVEYISNNKKKILNELNHQQPNNIRTLKFIIAILVVLLQAIYNIENKSIKEYSELYDCFSNYIVLRAIQYKINPKLVVDWGNNDFGLIYRLGDNDDAKELIRGFKFIDIYINSSYLDNQLLKDAYENELKLYEDASLAFNHLVNWTQCCDERVCECLNQLKDEVKNQKYKNSMLRQILWLVASIKHYTVLKYDFDNFIEDIKSVLYDDNAITKDILLQQNKDDCVYKTYKELINPLVEIADENYKKRLEKLNLFKYLSSSHMSDIDLLKYIHANINEYYNAKEFAKYLGTIDELNGYFISASERDIDSFRGIIRTVYLQIANIGQFLGADRLYLEEILAIVKSKIENEKYGAIMKFNLACLVYDLESVIKILKLD